MFDNAKERNKWKVRITNCVNSSEPASKPVCKCMAEVIAGILGSGSLQLSKISQGLKDVVTSLGNSMDG